MKSLLPSICVKFITRRYLHSHCNIGQLKIISVPPSQKQKLYFRSFLNRNLQKSVPIPLASEHIRYFCVEVKPENKLDDIKDNTESNPINEGIVKSGNRLNLRRGIQRNRQAFNLKALELMCLTRARKSDEIFNICNELKEAELKFSIKENSSLIYYLSVLNVPDYNLISKVLQNLAGQLDEVYKPVPIITNISKSLANLLIRDTNILFNIVQWYLKRINGIDKCAVVNTLHMLAVLNFLPPEAETIIKHMMTGIPDDFSSTTSYLDFVWAATIFDKVEKRLVESVLNYNFIKKLQHISSPATSYPLYLKLNNIHAYAIVNNIHVRMDARFRSAVNPFINKMKQIRERDALIKSVIDSVSNILPPNCFVTFREFVSGCIIDAVCFFDSNCKPVTEIEFAKEQNGMKLAIIVLTFKDLCFPNKDCPTGIIAFHKRHLELSGFHVLFIPYKDIKVHEKLGAKSKYLKNRIQNILPGFKNDNECFV